MGLDLVLIRQPMVHVGLTIMPLVFYHFVLRKLARQGISQSAIDSVYYFGFLITVAALAMSALVIATGGADSSMVIRQFGVGLLATGYAIFARLHLNNIGPAAEGVSPEALANRYASKTYELLTNLEAACDALVTFSDNSIRRSVEVNEAARAHTESIIRSVTEEYAAAIRESLSGVVARMEEIRIFTADGTLLSQQADLVKSMAAVTDSGQAVSKEMIEMSKLVRLGSAETRSLTEAIGAAHSKVQILSESMRSAEEAMGTVKGFATSVEASSQSIQRAAIGIGDATAEVAKLSIQATETAPTFKSMRSASKKAHDQLEHLHQISVQFDASLTGLSGVAGKISDLAESINAIGTALPTIRTRVDHVLSSLDALTNSCHGLSHTLDTVPRSLLSIDPVAAATIDILSDVHMSALATRDSMSSLKRHSADAENAVVSVKNVFHMADRSREALDSAIGSLETLRDTLSTVGQTSLSATEGLREALHNSASQLEADVKRSSEAAALLTDRLVGVAEGIIEATRAHGARR